MSDGVVVQRGEELGRTFAKALINGRSEAGVTLIFDHCINGILGQHRLDPAFAAVIDDDDLEIAERLPLQGFDAFEERRVRRQSRNHNSNARTGQV